MFSQKNGFIPTSAVAGNGFIEINSAPYSRGNDIRVDSSGNIYAVGYYRPNVSVNQSYMFIVKYNSNGVIQWQKNLASTSTYTTGGFSLTLDSSNNIYVLGSRNTNNTGDPKPFIVKYDNAGTVQWQFQASSLGAGSSLPNSIALDGSGNIYIVTGKATLPTGLLLVKFNSSGTQQWQKFITHSSDVVGNGNIAVDSSGNVYFSANYTGGKIFVAKFNTSGSFVWQRVLTKTNYTYGYGQSGSNIKLDSTGNIYVMNVGYLNVSPNTRIVTVVKLNNSGTIQWQQDLGGQPISSSLGGNGLALDSSNNIYFACFGNSVSGSQESIVVKYDSSGNLVWQRNLSNLTPTSIACDNNNVYPIGVYYDGTSNYSKVIYLKVPNNGTPIGTYNVGGVLVTYDAATLTQNIGNLSSATSTMTSNNSTELTFASSSYTTGLSPLGSVIAIMS